MKKKLLIGVFLGVVIAGIVAGIFLAYQYMYPQKTTSQQTNTNTNQAPAQKKPAQPPSYVDQTLSKLSLRDKVASLFIFHTSTTDPATLASYYNTHKPAGLILMGDNIPYTFAELRAETSALVTDKQLPPLIAIDEEGDTVTRLAADTYPGALTLRNQPATAAKTAFTNRSNMLKSLGINLNFGIDADVTADPNSFIYPRVLGTTPQAASDRVAQAVAGSEGITLSTIKHFPGHGETGVDSHTAIPNAPTSFSDWQQRDALPFQAGINAGADMVMFGHLRYSAVDQQPASLSSKWHDIVRGQLGFKGVVITDDMIMLQDSGEAAYADPVRNAILALQAGNDLLLYVLNHGSASSNIDPSTLIDGVAAAVQTGQVSQKTIDERARNVHNLRHSLAQSFYGQD
jgi:beta-N-acetylhexosaminidase